MGIAYLNEMVGTLFTSCFIYCCQNESHSLILLLLSVICSFYFLILIKNIPTALIHDILSIRQLADTWIVFSLWILQIMLIKIYFNFSNSTKNFYHRTQTPQEIENNSHFEVEKYKRSQQQTFKCKNIVTTMLNTSNSPISFLTSNTDKEIQLSIAIISNFLPVFPYVEHTMTIFQFKS